MTSAVTANQTIPKSGKGAGSGRRNNLCLHDEGRFEGIGYVGMKEAGRGEARREGSIR